MCSARACLIIWTSLIFACVTTLLILHIVEYKDEGFVSWHAMPLLICFALMTTVNLAVLIGAICKIPCLLCLAAFFIGFALFIAVSAFILRIVFFIIDEARLKKHTAGEIAVFVGIGSAFYVALLLIPCFQYCALKKTRKNLENEGGASSTSE